MSLRIGELLIPQLNIHKTTGSGQGNYQSKTVSPTTSQQTITADSNYDALSSVTIGAMPIAAQATPVINISNSTGVITASATQSAGYVSAGTTTATSQLSVEAEKTVTPTSSAQTVVAAGKFTTGAITVAAVPTETKTITTNGTVIPTTGKYFSSVTVNVPTGSTINNQDKSVTPTESQQSIQADDGYTGLGTVTVGAISSTYVGSDITVDPTPTVSGRTVTIPKGYYSTNTSASVAAGTAGTPTATKGTVSNNSISITPKVTNTTGYITGGTKTGTAVTVSASELVSGNKSITANGTNIDVANYSTVSVAVPTGSTITNQDKTVNSSESDQTVTYDTGYTGLGTVTISGLGTDYVGSEITRRDDTDLTASGATVTVPAGYYAEQETKSVSTTTHPNPSVSVNTTTGLITASHTQTAGYVSAGTTTKTSQLTTQNGSTITPTESEQTAVAANTYTLGAVKVGAISSTYVGSGITQRDSSDLTASGATVTAPAGYYASAASKSVSSMTLPTAASSTSSGTSKATIGRSTSAQYINIPTGYNSTASYYTISATPNGSVTAPSSISGTSATVSTGTNTLTLTKTVSVTPNVTTAGYISSGTAGNASVSLTANITTQGASTITPSTSSQTAVASGVYTTGAVTVAAIPSQYKDLSTATTGTAADLLSGETLYDSTGRLLTGTLQFVTYYTGSSAPSSSIGNDGDIYLQEA